MIIGIFVKTTVHTYIIVRLFIRNKPIYIQVVKNKHLKRTENSKNIGCFCRSFAIIYNFL